MGSTMWGLTTYICKKTRLDLINIPFIYVYSKLAFSLSTTFLNIGGGRVGHAPVLGYDHLYGNIGRLHTIFQISATLSKNVLIFRQNQNGGTLSMRNS